MVTAQLSLALAAKLTDASHALGLAFCVIGPGQLMVGIWLSTTFTSALQVALLPLLSVTVSTTRFVPMLEQSKLVLSRLRLAMPQGALLPLSICAVLMVAWPVASKGTVRFRHTATGVPRVRMAGLEVAEPQ